MRLSKVVSRLFPGVITLPCEMNPAGPGFELRFWERFSGGIDNGYHADAAGRREDLLLEAFLSQDERDGFLELMEQIMAMKSNGGISPRQFPPRHEVRDGCDIWYF